ncbi:MAG: ribosome maturation factor RimP [Acidimicrobiales bacterium]|nr:ribosome maturation factor RimP [Acidimicrobiales bacterium]
MTAPDRLTEIIEPVIAGLGLDLYDLESGGGLVRVLVDRPGGVDLDALSAATRAVSGALDAADPIAGRYTLEVSSPGLERPLRTPAHFEQALGATVAVRTRPGSEGERRVRGVLRAAGADGIVVELDEPAATGAGPAERRLRYDEIERARTVFEWGPAPRPGSTKQSQQKRAASR